MNFIDKTIKNIIGNKKRGGKNDIDGDGVPNRKDCQPRNTMRQDSRVIVQARMKNESVPKTYEFPNTDAGYQKALTLVDKLRRQNRGDNIGQRPSYHVLGPTFVVKLRGKKWML